MSNSLIDGGPQNWPLWSLDLSLLDIHVWGYMEKHGI